MLHEIDLTRIDLNLLVLFEAVFEERHVGRAAARLHLSPSAVSHGIGRLRRALNDPVFLKHPKGVVPTAEAAALAAPIAAVLAQVRALIGGAVPFDPARSKRRFRIGAPDAIAAVMLPPVLGSIWREAPGVELGVTELEPSETLNALDEGRVDIACYPLEDLPARFEGRTLYREDFVVAARSDHAYGRRITLERYCSAPHLLVSPSGGSHGFVDDVLASRRTTRRVALTVPSFMGALCAIAESGLIGTLPRNLVTAHGDRWGVVAIEPPMELGASHVRAVATRAALGDAGVAWLMELLVRAAGESRERAGVSRAGPSGRRRPAAKRR